MTPRRCPTHGRACLTPTEQQVVELVKLGSSNDAISHRLGLSVATIDEHLQRIFAKLGVHPGF